MKRFAVFLAALCVLGLAPERYVRSVGDYAPPDVTLTDMDGRRLLLSEALGEGPVLLQFIFTTCPAVCPMLSATLAGAQDRLPGIRMVSISIDPEHDTPERLRAYAQRFRAGPQWKFLTGRLEDVVDVQKAFGVYRSDKMQHEPSTFLRAAQGPWVRLTGRVGEEDLVSELHKLSDLDRGRRIYQEGALGCANCHRRSGFGASEGGVFVPPVTGPFLFQLGHLERTDLFRELYQEVQSKIYLARVRDPRPRPAYTEASLARVLREGIDPADRNLDPLMPRYPLSDEDIGHLTAYLRTLSAAPSPGVDAETIHFATVFTPNVDPAERRALLAVMEAFFQRKNADTEGLLRHAGGSPWYKDDLAKGFRKWVLHLWDLQGSSESWRGQLESHAREQPVFALLSGAGDWRAIHEFCEREEVPCLFPSTLLPGPSGLYTIYFSSGLAGEASALARYLEPSTRVVQVYRDTEEGRALAEAFRKERSVVDLRLKAGDPIPRGLAGDDLVLWLDEKDFAALPPTALAGFRRIYLSSSLVEPDPRNPLREKLSFTYPYTLPGREGPHVYRVRAWLRSRGIERTHERLQLNTFYALSLAEHALDHMAGSFSRDFFVESVEREAEVELNPGVFPRLSLGPGQRLTSKGCYIVRLGEQGIEPLSDWIVTE
ncbi:MAG TPA: SCO family protein [Thermoanaerobaculia bacterium]|nr:SCO family protein [Thermoanaerobaculia bacterium]